MPIDVFCKRCGEMFRVDSSLAGKTGRCSSCRALTRIPDSEGRIEPREPAVDQDRAFEIVDEGEPTSQTEARRASLDRMFALEEECRLLRQSLYRRTAGMTLALGIVLIASLSSLAFQLRGNATTHAALQEEISANLNRKILTAEGFSVVDEKGKARAFLTSVDERPALVLFCHDGSRIELAENGKYMTGPHLSFIDPRGRIRLFARTTMAGEGSTEFGMCDGEGVPRIAVECDPIDGSASIILLRPDAKSQASLSLWMKKSGKSGIRVEDKDGRPVVQLPLR